MKKTGAERNHSPALQYQGPVLFFSLFVSLINAQPITLTLVKDTVLPVKGSSFGMSCSSSVSFYASGITLYKSGTEKGACLGSSHNCVIKPGTGIVLKANLTGVFITISSLERDSHEGTWTCTYGPGSTNINSNAVNLTVYTIPLGLRFTQVPNMNVDLSVTSAQLQCTTSGCTYPPPLIQWLIQGQTGSSLYEVYKTLNPTVSGSPCVSPEQLYTSTLDLQQNTTWSDNSDKIVTFSCRIEYQDSTMNLIASGSQTIRFAIRVKEAFLQYNNQNITSILNVTSGEQVTLTCVIGASQPAPSIDWYIGSWSMGSGTSLIFTPSNTDHNQVIYCQAYNTDPNLKVDSNKPSLFVRVQVTEAFLQYNNQNITSILTVTSGEQITLTCVTGTSRPVPNIDWYIGSQSMGSGTSLIFTPSNTDHNEMIYCQAYNIDPNQKVESNKLRLFVRVLVSSVTLEGSKGGNKVFNEGYPQNLKCNSSPSRPVPIIRWLLDNKYMTDNITNINITDADGLYVLKSEITLVLMRNSSNQKIRCEGFISGQETKAVSTEVIVDVWYAPDVKVKVNISGFTVAGSTAILMCVPQGNPQQYTFHPWIHRVEQTEIRRLDGVNTVSLSTLSLSNISIQDMGAYICTVDNSITGLNGQINQMGDTYVYVQGLPVFDRTQLTFAGEPNKSADIEIPFYSYPSIKLVKFINQSDSSEISNTSNIAIFMPPANITMMFYEKKVMRPGHVAVLHFRNLKDTDFGNYTLRLSNDQGTVSLQFDLIVSVSSTTDKPPSPVVRDFQVGAVVGGVLGGFLVVIAIVVVVFVIKRRTLKPKMEAFEREVDSTDRNHRKSQLVNNPVYDASNSRPGTVIAVVTHDPSKLYAQVDKTQTNKEKGDIRFIVAATTVGLGVAGIMASTTIIATAKGKHGKTSRAASKGKHGKMSRGDIYENTTQAVKSSAESEYENPGQLATGPSSVDNVYETPEASVSKDKMVNKEGLLYADVVLGPPTKKAGKPVIHGLEDRTEYADIAFGKRGEPLPETDEEKENGGAKKKNGTKLSTDK